METQLYLQKNQFYVKTAFYISIDILLWVPNNQNQIIMNHQILNTLPENRATTELMSLDEVYDSLDDYKEVINNVYSLNKLLNDYDEEIKEKANENDDNAINSILGATLHEEYDKTNEKYCEIIELARSKNEVGGCRVLFTCKHYESLDGMSLMNVMTANTCERIDQLSFTNVAKLLENRIFDMSHKIPKYGKTYVHAGFGVWTGGIRLYFNLVRKHPIIENKWIMISSGININNYLSKPISNYKLRVIGNWSEHPIKLFIKNGIRCTISTDDPLSFNNSIIDEYVILHEKLSLRIPELADLIINGFEVADLPEEKKSNLIENVNRQVKQISSIDG